MSQLTNSSLPKLGSSCTSGIFTKKRYRYATIFVDHYSDLKYVHYMEYIKSRSAGYAKEFFEH